MLHSGQNTHAYTHFQLYQMINDPYLKSYPVQRLSNELNIAFSKFNCSVTYFSSRWKSKSASELTPGHLIGFKLKINTRYTSSREDTRKASRSEYSQQPLFTVERLLSFYYRAPDWKWISWNSPSIQLHCTVLFNTVLYRRNALYLHSTGR